MNIYSYIVVRDFGFAPNPFFGTCTLAACKPKIRKGAKIGDYIVGLTPKGKGNNICYIMEVTSKMSFNEYWIDPKYANKKPKFNTAFKSYFGDNIYHQKDDGEWHQANSHHSREDGTPITKNIETDTGSTDQLLLSTNFSYWGKDAISLPPQFSALKVGRSHKCKFDKSFIDNFIVWNRNLEKGLISTPEKWTRRSTFK